MTYKPRRPTALERAEAAFARNAHSTFDVVEVGTGTLPTQPKGRQSHARRGLSVEGMHRGKGAAAVLRAEGYRVIRSHASQGAADVIALRDSAPLGPAARAVQVKRVSIFVGSALNDAVRRFLGLGRWLKPWTVSPDTRRECWLWADDRGGWAARLAITADGVGVVDIDGEGEEVVLAVNRMLERERNRPAETSSYDAFKRRMEIDE